MIPKIRQILYREARNYSTRDAYISDLALSSIWGDAPDEDIPSARLELLGRIYDAAHATVQSLLADHHLSQSDFARCFCIPLRTVQDWVSGRSKCPPYVLAMASELLSLDP